MKCPISPVNLIAPIVFNIKNHKAKQCAALGDKYNTRHFILSEDDRKYDSEGKN
ncbi:flagellar assembly protein FliW [uncultured Brachyspira sp.]|uniref:flagellar assembly protein FliW n=1 Tax=uncultured Brachyspira sp. TaxID=221953 RepID=UPI00258490D6|nr:flagellar assembly protein FliW [uncultured Brachyspira sp.]